MGDTVQQHDQFEIVPAEDGTWGWQKRVGGSVVDEFHGYEARSHTLAEVRAMNGDETLEVRRTNGQLVRTIRDRKPDALRVVLLRLDGSLYGELDPPPSNATGEPHRITLTPATESGEAVTPDG